MALQHRGALKWTLSLSSLPTHAGDTPVAEVVLSLYFAPGVVCSGWSREHAAINNMSKRGNGREFLCFCGVSNFVCGVYNL